MNKFFKNFCLVMLTVALCISTCIFSVGCEKEATNFEIAVTYPDGSVVKASDGTGGMNGNTMYIQLCNSADGKCYKNVELDENGKVSIPISDVITAIGEGTYKVYVVGAPNGYKDVLQDENFSYGTISKDSASLTIKLVTI